MLRERVLREIGKAEKYGMVDTSAFEEACGGYTLAYNASGGPKDNRYRSAKMINMLKTVKDNLNDVAASFVVKPRFWHLWIVSTPISIAGTTLEPSDGIVSRSLVRSGSSTTYSILVQYVMCSRSSIQYRRKNVNCR